jgi:pre-mRNA cleavage complex 2 protein Pcf11
MDAYTLMDMPTRKAMEGLLKTWKQPVPESMDTRPVFPSEVTRDIENALIKYRTVAIQQQALSQKQALHRVLLGIPLLMIHEFGRYVSRLPFRLN